MKFVTLHVRLTRDCNAHCSYCSSAGAQEGRMSVQEFRTAIDFISSSVLPRLGMGKEHYLTVEYLGGEVLVVPEQDLEACVTYARDVFRPQVAGFRDGAQSNLIGSKRRILALDEMFDGRIGTSWDSRSGARKIAGSADLYRALLGKSLKTLREERDRRPGRVIVVDRNTAPYLLEDIAMARLEGCDLVLRPVFAGGSPGISPLAPSQLADLMTQAFRAWIADPRQRIEPFHSLYQRRALRGKIDPTGTPAANLTTGCPFQSECAFRSLALDPDGSLHVCQEMADSGHYPLGNAITGSFDERTWRMLARRSAHLDESCSACPWRQECGGGCMNEAILHHGDPFAKTELCQVWKALFAEIDTCLAAERTS